MLLAAIFTVLCGAGLLLVTSGPVAVIVGLPIVLLLPGLAVTTAVLPGKPWRGDVLAWAVGISLACDIALGVVLNEVTRLTRRTEIAALALLALIGFVVAAVRRRGHQSERDGSSGQTYRRLRQVLSPSIVLAAMVTAVAVGSACWLSVSSAHAQNTATYTELWLSPGQGSAAGTTDLGVRNDERQPTGYTLLLTTSAGTTTWDLRLQPRQTWHVPITVPADGQASAKLYRDGADTPYRVVDLSPSEGS